VAECDKFYSLFDGIFTDLSHFNATHFNKTYIKFSKFLYEANQRLPGPMHPKVKNYRRRKAKKASSRGTQHKKSSNPMRTNARRRQWNRDKYHYELAQYNYYNRRRRVADDVLSAKSDSRKKCTIPMETLESYFQSLLSDPNDLTLSEYPVISTQEDVSITLDDVNKAIRSTNMDTAPGLDRILARTIKDLPIGSSIKRIIDIMLVTGSVPTQLSEGKTVLFPKEGDLSLVSNWRPISLYSIIRRIIERVLDKKLRSQLDLNANQKGFVAGVPGCHVNSALINKCLLQAKADKSDCVVVFLDVSKAFDKIGHTHIEKWILKVFLVTFVALSCHS
jgi:hypothetical protein